ncbi:MAG: RHS repeat-associated core domain-containing protein [Anaerolineae bacterium]|nr:RHS repeat-associated core domain-containing protein [Anaerolineae bacterium]
MSADIGTVGVTGSADETSGTFTIEGGGTNIGGTEDAFHFVYQTLYGDGSITANVASLSGGGTTPRAGLMMRDGLADDAAHVSAVVQGNRIRLLDRASAGGNTTDALGHNQGAPEWIRIERSGSTFTLSRSNDGSSWAVMDTRTISMGTMIYIGMAVTGNSTTTLATGVFDNVATTGSGATPTPTVTNTPLPTNTPTATNTPVSTNTPTPTYTPTPSTTPAPDVLIKRSSYGIAGQMVAFRVTGDPVSANNGLFYVLSDHLGSTSLLVNSSGSTVTGSTTRYLPFGGYRGTPPSQTITDRDFTGQKENMELGLLYYQARFYVPGIGRFASADTLVPDPGNPQAYNRYSYVENRPPNFNDPTGHCKNPGECVVVGGSGGPVGDEAYTSLLAKILVGYVKQDQTLKSNSSSGMGIEPFQGSTLGETLWNISTQDTNTIVAAHNGNTTAALNSYIALDYMAQGGALMAMSTGLNSAGNAPFGQPPNPSSTASSNPSTALQRGNQMHYDALNGGTGAYGPSQLQARYPNTQFRFARRGQAGADVTVVPGANSLHPSQYPNSTWPVGAMHGDFKPNTYSGAQTFFRQINSGKLPADTVPIPYNPNSLTITPWHSFASPWP